MSVLDSGARSPSHSEDAAGGDAAKERRSRADLRELLLATAREILDEEGIQAASSNLTFKRVFERVEQTTGRSVTNASVIRRVWDNMADFQADVLIDIAQDERRPELDQTLEAIRRVLNRSDLSTVASRRLALREMCRVGGEGSAEAARDSVLWSLWISVLAIATTAPDRDRRDRMTGGLLDSFDALAGFWEDAFAVLFARLGFRVREPRTIRQFTEAVLSWSQGNSIRQRVSGAATCLDLPTGPGGELQRWTLFGIGLEGLVDQFFEPDPEFVPGPSAR